LWRPEDWYEFTDISVVLNYFNLQDDQQAVRAREVAERAVAQPGQEGKVYARKRGFKGTGLL
jgi:hypothetical protein